MPRAASAELRASEALPSHGAVCCGSSIDPTVTSVQGMGALDGWNILGIAPPLASFSAGLPGMDLLPGVGPMRSSLRLVMAVQLVSAVVHRDRIERLANAVPQSDQCVRPRRGRRTRRGVRAGRRRQRGISTCSLACSDSGCLSGNSCVDCEGESSDSSSGSYACGRAASGGSYGGSDSSRGSSARTGCCFDGSALVNGCAVSEWGPVKISGGAAGRATIAMPRSPMRLPVPMSTSVLRCQWRLAPVC